MLEVYDNKMLNKNDDIQISGILQIATTALAVYACKPAHGISRLTSFCLYVYVNLVLPHLFMSTYIPLGQPEQRSNQTFNVKHPCVMAEVPVRVLTYRVMRQELSLCTWSLHSR